MRNWFMAIWGATKETTDTIIQIGVVVSMLGGIGIAIGNFFIPKTLFQWVSFYILVIGLLLLLITLFLNWKRKKEIERIPDLIEKLDVLASNWVDDFKMELSEDDWGKINQDYSSLFGLDLTGLEKSMREVKEGGGKKNLERAFESVNRKYNQKLDPNNKTAESLANLGDMGSILDAYNSGFARLKETSQYQKLAKKIKSLQRQAPSAYISMQENDYFVVSERLYIMVLGTKPLYEQPLFAANLPAIVKAKKSQIRPVVDSQISNLIAGVREAILKHKERNQEQKPTEQKPPEPQNRVQRRGHY